MGTNEPIDEPRDGLLVERMAAGDREAFATLFRRHHRLVYRFCVQMSGSRDLAEDLTQEVFIALAQSGRSYDPEKGSLPTYLYGIVRRLLQRRRRRRGSVVEIELNGFDAINRAVVVASDPIDTLSTAQGVRVLRRAIVALPAHYREVIVLCELNGLSYEDAAQVVGCRVGTVRLRLSRARRLLADRCRAILCAPGEGPGRKPLSWVVNRRSRMLTPES